MKCPLCGCRFEVKDARTACRGCPMAGACHMLRCPNCGYDIPAEGGLVKAVRGWRKRLHGARGKG